MKRVISVFLLSLLLAIPCLSVHAQAPDTSPAMCPQRMHLTVGSHRFEIPYCRSHALSDGHRTATTAVIVIQSSSLNAGDVYKAASDAAGLANRQGNTVIFAPQFAVQKDIAAHNLANNVPVWGLEGWKFGEDSLKLSGDRAYQVSSFTVIDELIRALYNKSLFPRLASVVIVGHSAGGQFVQRYAALNGIDAEARAKGLRLRYVVMNPNTYLYLDNQRLVRDRPVGCCSGWLATVDSEFIEGVNAELPAREDHNAASSDCKDYNKYPKGLDGRQSNPYAARRPAATIKQDYLRRDVRYLSGALDRLRPSEGMSTDCTSDVQGFNRAERANFFWGYLMAISNNTARNYQWGVVSVQGVDHSSAKMIKSPEGLKHIFDYPTAVRR